MLIKDSTPSHPKHNKHIMRDMDVDLNYLKRKSKNMLEELNLWNPQPIQLVKLLSH